MKKNLILLSLLFSVAVYSALLTDHGKATAEIVLGKTPTCAAQFAALELQYHLKLVSGAEIPIVAEAGTARTKIILGRAGEVYKPQEYEISVKGNTVILAGNDAPRFQKVEYSKPMTWPDYWEEQGTLYAAYDFLEMLGVHWYLPTDMGITYKKRPTVALADTAIRRCPTFLYRDTMALNMPADLCGDTVGERAEAIRHFLDYRERELWYRRMRHGGQRVCFCHSLYTYYSRFYATHKAWFAQGQEVAEDMQLCYTNPEVIAQVVKDARDFFDGKVADTTTIISGVDKNFHSKYYPMGAMDNRRWCKCAKCQEILHRNGNNPDDHFSKGNVSEYWYTFVAAVANELKKSHPDCFVATHCYSGYTMPPRGVKLPSNVIVRPVLNVTAVYQPTLYEDNAKILQAWKSYAPDAVKYIAIWFCHPNFDARYYKTRYFPHFISGSVKKYFKDFLDFGAVGMGWEPSYALAGAGPAFDMVDGYLNWKLAWNKDLDTDKLFNELFNEFYGPAANAMRTFYRFAEGIYSNPANYPADAADDFERSWVHVGSTARMARLQSFVDEAEKAALTDPYRSRVQWFKNGLWNYMLKGKASSDKMRSELLANASGRENLIPGGDFDSAPVGAIPAGFTAPCKVVTGGFHGNALMLFCKIKQGEQYRSASNILHLKELPAGRYRLCGFVKGEFTSALVKLTGKGASGNKVWARLHLTKDKLMTGQNQWRIFRQEFTVSEKSQENDLLFVLYGPKDSEVLLDDFVLENISSLNP